MVGSSSLPICCVVAMCNVGAVRLRHRTVCFENLCNAFKMLPQLRMAACDSNSALERLDQVPVQGGPTMSGVDVGQKEKPEANTVSLGYSKLFIQFLNISEKQFTLPYVGKSRPRGVGLPMSVLTLSLKANDLAVRKLIYFVVWPEGSSVVLPRAAFKPFAQTDPRTQLMTYCYDARFAMHDQVLQIHMVLYLLSTKPIYMYERIHSYSRAWHFCSISHVGLSGTCTGSSSAELAHAGLAPGSRRARASSGSISSSLFLRRTSG